ncbi:T-lymphocyte surface antigen Ly-9-like isoform X2 [Equus quagga]|uniref:T-lymphocyte surface antigen Ly-9-like isoform X2 n=1 Tax=Equus quagga TaxID=89248 RepID=UPI001EE2F3CC|nr:T-lymphocyte surface antigen Ly-9-like isoform X2 [Equus quagga]
MGPCSEDPHLCWASWLLGFSSLLLNVCSTEFKSPGAHDAGGQDSGSYVSLKGIRGGSVWFHVTKESGTELEEIVWAFGPAIKHTVMLRVHKGSEETPTWVSLQDKYMQRVHVPNMTSLRIENLTREDSGKYWARASLTGGMESHQIFDLTVYEPVPLPQIQVQSVSTTPGWCNITLECRAAGVTEDLNVTWESKDLPRELEPARNSWTLAVSLPLSQPNASLTCVVSNSKDRKTVTSSLGKVCAHDSQGHASTGTLKAILGPIVAVPLILGVGLYLWKTHEKKKKMEIGRGAGLQEEHRNHDDDIQYAELSLQESRGGRDKGMRERMRERRLQEKEDLTAVYSEVQKPGQARP